MIIRLTGMGPELVRFKDRHDKDMVLREDVKKIIAPSLPRSF